MDDKPELDVLIDKLRADVERISGQGDPTLEIVARMKLGQALLEKKEAPAALTQFDQALKLVKETGDKETQARLFGYQGMALKMIGNYAMALQAFRKSNGIASSLKHETLLCDSFIQIGVIQAEMGKPADAQADLERALELATQNLDGTRRMRISGLLADNYFLLKEYPRAQEAYRLACELAGNLGNHTLECSFLVRQGNVSLEAGDPRTAVQQYERALDIASAIEDRNAEINILGGLFRSYAQLQDAPLAVLYGEKVIELAAEIQHFEAEITNLHDLAVFYIEQAQYLQAYACLERGRQAAGQNRSQDWLMTLALTDGIAHHRAGDTAAAIENYQQALSLAKGTADRRAEVQVLGYLSTAQAELGLLPESIQSAEHALALAGELGDPALCAEQQMLLAFNYRDQRQEARAAASCRAAIESYQKCGDLEAAGKAQALLHDLQAGPGR